MNIKFVTKLIVEFICVLLFFLSWGVAMGILVTYIFFQNMLFGGFGVVIGILGAYTLGPIFYYGLVRGNLNFKNFILLFSSCSLSAVLSAPFSPFLSAVVAPAVFAIGCFLMRMKADEKKEKEMLGINKNSNKS